MECGLPPLLHRQRRNNVFPFVGVSLLQFSRRYNVPPELKCLVTSKYEYSRVLGVGKLLHTDGRKQYFLFVLKKGERAKA